jgi:hypothetical protein
MSEIDGTDHVRFEDGAPHIALVATCSEAAGYGGIVDQDIEAAIVFGELIGGGKNAVSGVDVNFKGGNCRCGVGFRGEQFFDSGFAFGLCATTDENGVGVFRL